MRKKYVVATIDEIQPGQRKIVDVAGRSIGIFNVNGEFFAIRNRCPHAGAPLCAGVLSGVVESVVPGEYTYSRQGEIVRCPWHQWEFDVKTGQSWFDPIKTRVRSYDARIEPGCSLYASTGSELQKEELTAETFPVTVDKDYVVLELEP